jgi:hypothetical protein
MQSLEDEDKALQMDVLKLFKMKLVGLQSTLKHWN